jgi:leucyl-tRNA synthetase
MWQQLGHEKSVFDAVWPVFDEKWLVDDEVEIAVQVNGRVRAKTNISTTATQDEAIARVKQLPEVAEWIEGKQTVKEIYVQGRLVNLVVKG